MAHSAATSAALPSSCSPSDSRCTFHRNSPRPASTATNSSDGQRRGARRQRRVEALHRGDVEGRLGPARGHVGRPPARRLEPHAQLVGPRARAPAVQPQVAVDLQVGPQRVEAAQRRARAVDHRVAIVFLDEGAEQAVPDDQDAAVVLVQVALVHAMVRAVVAGAAEPAVEPAQLAHLLRVHPELIQQVDQRHHAEDQRRHARHGQRQVEDPAEQEAAAGLAQRRARGCSPRSGGAPRARPTARPRGGRRGAASSSRSRSRAARRSTPTATMADSSNSATCWNTQVYIATLNSVPKASKTWLITPRPRLPSVSFRR